MVHQSGPMVKWPKTPASHAGNEGSNPSRVTNICGVYYGEDPPVPIPNTVVKLVRAENTWRAASRENRSMPQQKALTFVRALFIPYYKYFTPQAKPKVFGFSDASF